MDQYSFINEEHLQQKNDIESIKRSENNNYNSISWSFHRKN